MPLNDLSETDVPGTLVQQRLTVLEGGGWFDDQISLADDGTPALVSFTSGTTGKPKAILLSRGALGDVTQRLIDVSGLDHSVREYVGVPVTYSFGLGRARAVAAVGGRSFLPAKGFRPSELAEMLSNGAMNAFSAVPTMLRLVLAQDHLFRECGRNLRWLEIGSQPMSPEEKRAIRRLFPEARIVQHYGLTEASRSTFLDISAADYVEMDSVGRPNGSVEVRVDADDRICIRGPHLASGEITADGLVSLTDDEGWLRTGDLGVIDAGGSLHYQGRADNLINVGGLKVPLELFEQRLLDRVTAEQGSVAVASRSDPLRGQAIVLAYEPGADLRILRDKAVEVAHDFGLSAADFLLVEVAAIPRTDTGKVRRNELSQLAPDLGGRTAPPARKSGGAISSRLAELLNREAIDPSLSYVELGGDSLTFVQVSMLLEEELGELPDDWELLPVSQLDALTAGHKATVPTGATMDTQIALRALAIIGVVLNHTTEAQIGGGAYLLLVLAGALFARFQYGRLISGDMLRGFAPFLVRLLGTYYLILAGYQFLRGDVDWRRWALIGNFFPDLQAQHSLLPFFWFIVAFVQLVLLFTLPFAVAGFRRRMSEHPWRAGFALTVAGFAVAVISRLAVHFFAPSLALEENGHFTTRTPMFLFYLFAFGWTLQFTRTRKQKLVMSAATFVMFPLIGVLPYAVWLILGSLAVIWIPRVPVPRHLKRLIGAVAGATFYIFLVHMFPVHVVMGVWPSRGSPLPNLLAVTFAIALGLLVAFVVDRTVRRVRSVAPSYQRIEPAE
ncbi:AMP-binding protein [Sphingomonas sp. BN140010]|uniref:AMP-binding protein n=1 Tax=Sphingomonas arvum TaxID=2992113 RepID=A0ABT3JH18_9SPHN|nr:AMP-binding protein [Sphingomonas sp. BN140010]MCW3798071.1 AMP-binding protein [Sphingomonas sp. BN140010]